MVGKNNREVLLKREANNIKRYAIKRTSVGVVSAVVAAGLLFGQDISVQADEITGTESQVSAVSSEVSVETESVEETEVLEYSQADAEQDEEITEESIEATEAYEEETSIEETEYDQTTLPTEETSIESYDEVEESAVEVQEVATNEEEFVETEETTVDSEVVSEDEETQENSENIEESTSTNEEITDAQPQMRTFAAAASDVSNEDTQLPELISISTDKDAYQAGEEIKVSAIVFENTSLDYVVAMFSRTDDSETGSVGLTGTSSDFVQQSDGTYLVEMTITTDEEMPSNTYELWNVSMTDSSSNTRTVAWYNDPNNLLDLQFDIVARDIDTELPKLISISTDKDVYQAGEEITVSAIVSENTLLDYVVAMFSRTDDSETGSVGLTGTSSDFVQQSDGTYLAEMTIVTDEKMPSNTYELWNVSMTDASSNTGTVSWDNDPNNLLNLRFDIVSQNVDTTLPELISISTDKDVYQAGEDIKVTAYVSEDTSLDYVVAMFSRSDDSETGPVGLTGTNSKIEQQPDGSYLVEMTIVTDEKIPSNTYELWNVSMTDSSGNEGTVSWYNDSNNLLNLQFDIVSINEDVLEPKLLDIYTDKQVYYAGENVKITAIVEEDGKLETIDIKYGITQLGRVPETPHGFILNNQSLISEPVRRADGAYVLEMIMETEESWGDISYGVHSVNLIDDAGNQYSLAFYKETGEAVGPHFDIISLDEKTDIPSEEVETPVEPEVPTEEEETPVEPEVPTEEEETPAEPEVPTEEEETPAEPEVPTEEEETPVEPEVPSEEEETPVEPEVPSEEVETPVDPEEPTEEEETPAEPEVPTEEEEMPVEPEVPTEEEETPAEPEVPSEEEETPVEPEVPSEEVETPVDPEKPTEEEETSVESAVPTEEETPSNSNQTSEVAAEEIVDSSVVNTEQLTAKETEGNVVATNIATKDSEDELVIDNQAATKVSESSEEEVAELPETGAQSMNALVTGLGMLTTAVGAFFIRKKK